MQKIYQVLSWGNESMNKKRVSGWLKIDGEYV